MPTYEYACKACGEHIEVVQSFRDEPLTTCPNCGGALRKVFGAIGISFKGSGFYKTDSRPQPKEPKEKAETGDGGDKSGDKSGDKAGDKAGTKAGATSDAKGSTSGSGTTTGTTDKAAASS